MSADRAAVWQRLIPQSLVCKAVYRIGRWSAPWLARPLNVWFAQRYALDLSEADKADPRDYPTLNALFTRALKPGARPVDVASAAAVSPVDGILTEFGSIDTDTLLQAKGMHYSLAGLAGERPADLEPFRNGQFATIYLAPHNYHRVHAPLAGKLVRTRYIPGTRYCVNAATTQAVPGLFSRNERAVLWFADRNGPWLVVMVGALNVSSISTSTRGEIPGGIADCWFEADDAVFDKGGEIGRFNLGSTVILVLPPGMIEWRADLRRGMSLRMGERIGTLAWRRTLTDHA